MRENRLDESQIGQAKVIVDILPKGHCIPNRKLSSISYITVHNTGSMSPANNQHRYMKNINKSGERQASWHFTVDDKEIYQAQSTNYECWHAGDSTGNKNSIGIEICQSDNKDTQEKIYRNTIALIKVLMKYHNLDISKVVQHNKWSGKSCPDYLRRSVHGYSWNWFIEQCKNNSSVESSSSGFKNGDYSGRKARVTTDVLRVRYDRGTKYEVIGKLKKGQIVSLNYCLNNWISIEGYKGNQGLGYVHTDCLELI